MALPPIPGLSRAVRGQEYSSPRTVLAFYAVLLGLLEAGVVVILLVLASQEDLHYLVPWVLSVGALVFLAIVGVVVAMNVIDPTKLQLGEMTGREFTEHHKITRGDSSGGDYIEMPTEKEIPETKLIPAAEVVDGTEKADSPPTFSSGESHEGND